MVKKAKVNSAICENCGVLISEDEIELLEGKSYCKDCIDDMCICERCGEHVSAENTFSVEEETWCAECYTDHSVTCEHCNFRVRNEDSQEVDGDDWCDACVENDARTCDCCCELTADVYEVEDGYVCEDCRDQNYVECYDCEGYFRSRNIIWCGDEEYRCRSCAEEYGECDCEDESRHILDYGFRIEPTFHFTNNEQYHGYVYGVELEVDKGGESHYHAGEVNNIMKNKTICKHDGSIQNGFEIVSYPCSLEYHKELDWKKAMEYLSKNDYRSHDTTTCGMHVHINRGCLGNNQNEQDQTIAKMLLFVEMNWSAFVKFTRRKQENLDRWARRYGVKKKDTTTSMLNKAKCGERYHTINLNPRNTVEIRAFRGTLNHKTFYATLEFVDSMVRFCRVKSVEEVTSATLRTVAEFRQTKYLLGYMLAKGLMELKQDDLPNTLFDQGEALQTLRTPRTEQMEQEGGIIANRLFNVLEVYNNRYRVGTHGRHLWLEESDVCMPNFELDPEYAVGDTVYIRVNPLNVPNYDLIGARGRVVEVLSGNTEVEMDGRYVVELENDYAFIFHGSCLSRSPVVQEVVVDQVDLSDFFTLSA